VCAKIGVPTHDSFQTVALYENKDMIAVITNIHSLGRVVQQKYLTPATYRGPTLGAKISAATPPAPSAAQRRAAAAAPTLLGKGSHGHATQAGMFDNSKNIVKTYQHSSSGVPTKMSMGPTGMASQAGIGRASCRGRV